jgi:hypothetical protein
LGIWLSLRNGRYYGWGNRWSIGLGFGWGWNSWYNPGWNWGWGASWGYPYYGYGYNPYYWDSYYWGGGYYPGYYGWGGYPGYWGRPANIKRSGADAISEEIIPIIVVLIQEIEMVLEEIHLIKIL